MTGLPSEDFIVLLDSNGAKRLASSFEMNSKKMKKRRKIIALK